MTERMQIVGGRVKPYEQPVAVAGLDRDAGLRLGRSLEGLLNHETRTQVNEVAGSLVAGTLSGIDRASSGNRINRIEPITRSLPQSDSLMAGVHSLSIMDEDIQYGPVIEGRREIRTNQHGLLKDVTAVFENTAGAMDRHLQRQIADDGARRWATAQAAGEITASVYDELRKRRDARRQEERERDEDKALTTEADGKISEVVVFEPAKLNGNSNGNGNGHKESIGVGPLISV
ncbi:MAG TPA: hypothetical protein VNA13_01050 [Xanthomonadales bacterium]|nr:hypothetical protein [Xanthomonadales bacterium]